MPFARNAAWPPPRKPRERSSSMELDPKVIAVILVAVSAVLGFFKAMGVKEGARKERHEGAARMEAFEGRLADAEEEAEFNKPLADRFSDMRERIRRRRAE